jgi:hypothetical protein
MLALRCLRPPSGIAAAIGEGDSGLTTDATLEITGGLGAGRTITRGLRAISC